MTATTARQQASKTTVTAFSYIRFSSRKQAEGDSQRRQTELAEAYCQRRGWKLSQKNYDDLGVSAFRGKNDLVGNLGEFLKAVKSGTVPEDSALIVESLDRISRQGIDEGYDVVKKILKAGIRLVTLTPEREFDVSATKSLSKGALEIQLILERAAEESERKSERIQAAWKGKRIYAREGKMMPPRKKDGRVTKAITSMLPGWVEEKGGKLRLIPERAAAVKRIFQLAASGYGRSRIVQALKAEGIPSFTGKKEWASCSIGFILTDRRALGEYQPCKTGRIPDGPPIPNYYPPAVSEQEFLAARAGMSRRRRNLKGGNRPWTEKEDELVRQMGLSVAIVARRTDRSRAAVYQRRHALGLTKRQDREEGGNFVNVFSGLIRNAHPPHDSYMVVTRMDGSGPSKALLNRGNAEGKAPCWLYQLAPFEKGVLGALREIDPKDVLPSRDDNGQSEMRQLADALAGIEAEINAAAAFMEAYGFSQTIGQRITALEDRKAELEKKLLDAKTLAACPAEAAWEEYGTLLDVLEQAPDQRDARLRLRSALRRMVSEIRLLVVPRGWDRLAAVQVHFVGGGWRDYMIIYRSARNNGKARWEGRWYAASARDFDPGDLRDRDDAEHMKEFLELYPKDVIERLLAKGQPLP